MQTDAKSIKKAKGSRADVHFIGEIRGASGFHARTLCCSWQLVYDPRLWAVAKGLQQVRGGGVMSAASSTSSGQMHVADTSRRINPCSMPVQTEALYQYLTLCLLLAPCCLCGEHNPKRYKQSPFAVIHLGVTSYYAAGSHSGVPP